MDATRRALLAQKINHIATQTDAHATILREKATGVQNDLILMLDKSADTDGTITIRKDRPGGCESIPCLSSSLYLLLNMHQFDDEFYV